MEQNEKEGEEGGVFYIRMSTSEISLMEAAETMPLSKKLKVMYAYLYNSCFINFDLLFLN
jgi:hypothetical protein